MIRQDFIAKIIEQMVTVIARMLKINQEKETQLFLDSFEEFLRTYYKISIDQLGELIKLDSSRDAILFDEKIKNLQLILFLDAAWVFSEKDEKEKALNCLQVVERIQNQNSHVFEFPSAETLQRSEKITKIKHKLLLD